MSASGNVSAYRAAAARGWFGYGHWPATYWFVGMEPGGGEDARVYDTWHDAGEPELLDLYAHSKACDDMRWVVDGAPLQTTWKQLIRLLLGYQGAAAEIEDVRRYQIHRLGRVDGETVLTELSALNATGLSQPVAGRTDHRSERIEILQQRVAEHQPEFVVCYGLSYRADYEAFAGGRLDPYVVRGTTVFALVPHPAARGSGTSQSWIDRGRELRAYRDTLAGKPAS